MYSCKQCKISFEDETEWKKHLQTHPSEAQFECQECGKFFRLKHNLNAHVRQCHSAESSECPKCRKVYKDMRRHMSVAHREEFEKNAKYSCISCEKKFSTFQALQLHTLKAHESVKLFQCTECVHIVEDIRSLIEHTKEIHGLSREFGCETCGRLFESQTKFDFHFTRMHKDRVVSFECTKCEKTFRLKLQLKRHLMKDHGEHTDLDCSQCDKTFPYMRDLRIHVSSVHKIERPFKCSSCDLSFSHEGILKEHMKVTHSGVEYFQCPKCSKFYPEKAYMVKHFGDAHPEIKDFSCDICGKVYPDKETLDRHGKKNHTKTHKCVICSKMCRDIFEYTDHIMEHSKLLTIPCSVKSCNVYFSSQEDLVKHERLSHKALVAKRLRKELKQRKLRVRYKTYPKLQKHFCYECNAHFDEHAQLQVHVLSAHRNNVPNSVSQINSEVLPSSLANSKITNGIGDPLKVNNQGFSKTPPIKTYSRVKTHAAVSQISTMHGQNLESRSNIVPLEHVEVKTEPMEQNLTHLASHFPSDKKQEYRTISEELITPDSEYAYDSMNGIVDQIEVKEERLETEIIQYPQV